MESKERPRVNLRASWRLGASPQPRADGLVDVALPVLQVLGDNIAFLAGFGDLQVFYDKSRLDPGFDLQRCQLRLLLGGFLLHDLAPFRGCLHLHPMSKVVQILPSALVFLCFC